MKKNRKRNSLFSLITNIIVSKSSDEFRQFSTNRALRAAKLGSAP